MSSQQFWKLSVKKLTGGVIHVHLANPLVATVLDLKKLIQQQDAQIQPHLQRLVLQRPSDRVKLQDDSAKLTDVGVQDGSCISLIMLPPFELYVQGTDQTMHTVVVPSSEPESYKISLLRKLVEAKVGSNLDDYMLQLQKTPLEEARHGKTLTLRDYGIKNGNTLFLLKVGIVLNINNPEVDVCFLVDCTSSMCGHIEAVKNNVQSLRDHLATEYKGCDLRFAFVRYTDYDQPESTRTTWIDFTSDPHTFRNFVGAVRAIGGGDTAEDIMGGLNKTFWKLSWRQEAAKILIHIADAPCHGRMYHSVDDSHTNGDPAGISHESMMQQVVRLEIQYWFGYINKQYTDQMIRIFSDCLKELSNNRFLIRQFDAVQPNEVGEAVKRSVTDSVYGSAAAKKASIRRFTIDTTVPNWSSVAIIDQYGKKTPPPGPKRLADLQTRLELEGPSVNIHFKIAPNPFADGKESLVYHGYDYTNGRRVVFKQFKMASADFNRLDCYMKELEICTVAAAYASEFNSHKQRPDRCLPLEFVPLDVVQCQGGGDCYLLENFVSGKIVKFSNNAGVVSNTSPDTEVLQAFSHFTYVRSGKTLLVCDLQGVQEGYRFLLTDPAIHSRTTGSCYGSMDRGYDGIKRFFKTHVCSSICRSMELEQQ